MCEEIITNHTIKDGNNLFFTITNSRGETFEKPCDDVPRSMVERYKISLKLKRFEEHQDNVLAILYLRISYDRNSIREGFDEQERVCKEYCENNDMKIIHVIRESKSAKDMSKLKGLRIIIDLLLTDNTYIVVHDVSRFTRNLEQAKNLLENLIDNQNDVISARENLRYSKDMEYFTNIMSMAEQYSRSRSEKSKQIASRKKEEGIVLGRKPIYGNVFVRNTEGKRIVIIDDDQMKLVEFVKNYIESTNILRYTQLEETLISAELLTEIPSTKVLRTIVKNIKDGLYS